MIRHENGNRNSVLILNLWTNQILGQVRLKNVYFWPIFAAYSDHFRTCIWTFTYYEEVLTKAIYAKLQTFMQVEVNFIHFQTPRVDSKTDFSERVIKFGRALVHLWLKQKETMMM